MTHCFESFWLFRIIHKIGPYQLGLKDRKKVVSRVKVIKELEFFDLQP